MEMQSRTAERGPPLPFSGDRDLDRLATSIRPGHSLTATPGCPSPECLQSSGRPASTWVASRGRRQEPQPTASERASARSPAPSRG